MDPKQKVLERKRKKRAKIRHEHNERSRNQQKQLTYLLSRGQPAILSVPARHDQDGWYRLNAIRDFSGLYRKALEMFPEDEVLKRYFAGTLNPRTDKKSYKYLSFLLTAVSQNTHGDPPFFFPYFDVIPNRMGAEEKASSFSFRKTFGDGYTSPKFGKTLTMDGKKYDFAFSSHLLKRLFERVAGEPKTGTIFEQVFKGSDFCEVFIGLELERTATDNLAAVVNHSPKVTKIVGINKPFGYIPYEILGDRMMGKTFLLIGMSGTPEKELVGNIPVSNIQCIHDRHDQMVNLGINPFTVEAKEAQSEIKK